MLVLHVHAKTDTILGLVELVRTVEVVEGPVLADEIVILRLPILG